MPVRERPFLYMGNLLAPKGTFDHTLAVHEEAKAALNNAAATREQVEAWVGSLRDADCFRQLEKPNGNKFLLWEDFCTTPQPHGLGYSPEAIEAIVSERKSKQAAAKATTGKVLPEGRPPKLDESSSLSQAERAKKNGVSLSTQKLLDLLARDHKDLHARVVSGELSVNAAAKAAGIVKDRPPLSILKTIWGKASPAERAEFRRWLEEHRAGQEA